MIVQAEKTETVATEMLVNEQTPHIQQGSTPAIADAKVENSTEIKETPEQENAPNNTSTLYTDADAENHNEDEKENLETDAAVVKPSTDEQDGTTDETEVSLLLTPYEKFRHDLVLLITSMYISSNLKKLMLSMLISETPSFQVTIHKNAKTLKSEIVFNTRT
jgi:hypothetical protein